VSEDTVLSFEVNGRQVSLSVPPLWRLSRVLRETLGLVGTKVGCEAGDCGACTVLLDGRQVCSCLVAVGQAVGRKVVTVEGLSEGGVPGRLKRAFHQGGAAQCGFCTPGMLMAAADLLERNPSPDESAVRDALGGVLCRCTGYRKIVEAVLAAARPELAGQRRPAQPAPGSVEAAVGARMPKTDGIAKLLGAERFGDDVAPADALWLHAVRSPYACARFRLGSFAELQARHPGLVRVLTARDIVGRNRFGIYPDLKDQPVLAEGFVRFRGEAIAALVGERAAIEAIDDQKLPISWEPQQPLIGIEAALAPGAPALHPERPDNVLVRGRVSRGDLGAGFAGAAAVVEGRFETAFVEHAYIEPEAGYARRVRGEGGVDRIEVVACTQTPYLDRDEIAAVLGARPDQVRIVPTAVGGGFGGKLDISLQPLVATAAWLLNRPVRCVYTRPESMAATTKRHPALMTARFACDGAGRLTAVEFHGDFNTGAYASWGPTVAQRVPIHASGPYQVGAVRATTRAVYTNETPAGAFRGFGVPQAAVVHETLMDELAERAGIDPLEFRRQNALGPGAITASGQRLGQSAGLLQCLQALEPRWRAARAEAEQFNLIGGVRRRGVGIACMWYGIGNTSMSNPSTMKVGLSAEGRLTLYNGAVDIGQGSNTILVQICADALGMPADSFQCVTGDTDLTADAGKTSASRQTFISGRAAELAGRDLRSRILKLAGMPEQAAVSLEGSTVVVSYGDLRRVIELGALKASDGGDVLVGMGRFDPPTTALDENGAGVPYATYAFAAQMAEVEVDLDLGTVKVLGMVAAHDVGRAINPTQVEGQVHGGIAQGLGMALMEEFVPGVNENLHDYLIATVGDMPAIEVMAIETVEPQGPFGAKGIGEPALIPTAPAILNAIYHATGVRIRRLPATPDRVRAGLLARRGRAALSQEHGGAARGGNRDG
jgi:CO/xanthine dehydrogenase Mo-binding subunit/aerobic-type carbon monoxide dehydrogenase small subunit (CoxS/CutS family)